MWALLRDFAGFVVEHRTLWLLPIAVALLLVAVLVALSTSSPLAPFIYPLF